jgi:hypothetical protein
MREIGEWRVASGEWRVATSRFWLPPIRYSLFAIRHPMPDPPPGLGIRDGTRGEGAPAWRCSYKSRLTGAPTRRLKVSIPRFFSP